MSITLAQFLNEYDLQSGPIDPRSHASQPDDATAICGQEAKRLAKLGIFSRWEGHHSVGPPSITATLGNHGCWASRVSEGARVHQRCLMTRADSVGGREWTESLMRKSTAFNVFTFVLTPRTFQTLLHTRVFSRRLKDHRFILL